MQEFFLHIWTYIQNNYQAMAIWALAIVVGLWLLLHFIRLVYQHWQSKHLVFLKVILPREDSPKDKEKETEKDFREKVSVMTQFFRNLSETRGLNIFNKIRVFLFKNNIFSFELVAHEKIIDFYITTPAYYREIIEKQITSYYPAADIQPSEPYEIVKKGNKVKGFYAYEAKKYWFPIKTYKTIENDPLNDLTNIFTRLSEDETAAIQIVLRPRDDKWSKKAEAFGEAFFKGKPKGEGIKLPVIGPILNVFKGIFLGYDKMEIEPKAESGGGYVRMLQSKEETAKRIGEKSNGTGFDTVIRLLSTAKTEERAEEISNNIIVSLNLFKDVSANYFQTRRIFFIDSINDILFLHNFKHRYLDNHLFLIGEKQSLMSEDELASLYHFPSSKYNYTPNIHWLDYKVLPAPVDTPTAGVLLGNNFYRGIKKEIYIQKIDRSRHHYIIGKSGSGKSALLSFMARQDAVSGEGFCIIDPHGDLVDEVIDYIPKERAKDVIIFDPADVERPMGLNILEATTPAEMDLAASQATEIFIKLFGDEIFGPRIQHYFRNACLTLMEDKEEGATLIDVPRIFVDDAFMKYKVAKVTNPVVKSFWEHEYANTGDRERQEMIPYFSAKFGPFITNTIMRNTIGQKNSAFDFRKVMDEGKILLVKLSKGKIGDLNTQLLGLVMVARIQMAAMSRTDIEEKDRKDFFLYVDEFQNFATDSFCSILSEARKYHLSLIMAHQYINQLVTTKFGSTSTGIRDAVFGNVGTLSSFKVGAEDAEYLAKEYAPLLTEQDVIGISNYKMYMKLNINNTTSRPFSVATIWDESKKNPKVGKIIREYARLKHGRKREFVEQEIVSRIGIDVNSAPIDTSKLPGQPNSMPPPTEANPMAQMMAAGAGTTTPPSAQTPPAADKSAVQVTATAATNTSTSPSADKSSSSTPPPSMDK
ncbi:type IV secretory system conjugative DNA transfer family protein [Candidatus Peregrinibacteria bacterium]|nr:type IV secretory system conjugative DNA transfer family protein [Candidatus Peregrinibacteria bacterium]